MYKRHRYVQVITMDAPIGGMYTYAFRANSCYDPDATGTGQQPITQDTFLGPLYSRACVLGSKCSVRYMGTGSTSSVVPGTIGVTCDPQLIVPSTWWSNIDAYRMSQTGRKLITGVSFPADIYTSNSLPVITARFSPRKMFNKTTKDLQGDPDFQYTNAQDVGADQTAWYNIIGAAIDSTLNPGAVLLQVTIDYLVCYTKRQPQDAS